MTGRAATIRTAVSTAQERMAAGDPAGALAATDAALAAAPQHTGLQRARFLALRALGREDEALATAQAIDTAAIGAPLLLQIVELFLARGLPDRARASLERWTPPAGGAPPEIVLAGARLAQHAGDSAAAIAQLQAGLGRHPGHPALAIRCARALDEAGRTEEAVALLSAAQAARPAEAGIAALLIQFLLDLGRPETAAGVLGRLPADLPVTLPLAAATARLHEEQGNPAAALAAIAAAETASGPAAGAAATDSPELQSRRWRLLALDGRRTEAVDACQAFVAARPDNLRGLIAAARFLQGIDRPEDCDAVLDRALALAPDDPGLISAAAEILLQRGDPHAALGIAEAAIRRGGQIPALLRPRLLHLLGRPHEAIAALTDAVARDVARPPERLLLARLQAALGDFAAAEATLAAVPPQHGRARAALGTVLAEIALARGRPEAAAAEADAAIAADPRGLLPLAAAARYRLFAGDLAGAWEAHCAWASRHAAQDQRGSASAKPLRSLTGQILNECRLLLDPGLLAPYRTGGETAILRLRAALAEDPGNTPAALLLFAALRRSGVIGDDTPPCSGPARIPRQVFQFWDSPEPPPQVAALIAANRAMNPGHGHRLFDLDGAARYLADHGETRALAAFREAPHVAAQADILRLAVLWHEGGIWIDADDRCLAPLADHLDHRCGFVGYQEDLMTVGNNFLAAAPGHPVLRAALDDAAGAFDFTQGETLWLATGPGAVTRAVALHGIDAAGRLAEGLRILPLHGLTRFLWPHVTLPYKQAEGHWVLQLGGRSV